jgi:DHA2 family multidrug resistance protein
MSGISRERMGNATAIFNLLRNLGGSVGVAFVTTMLARRTQFYQTDLVSHLSPEGRNLQSFLPDISALLRERGFTDLFHDQGSLGAVYNELLRQASMLAFNDVFRMLAVMMAFVLLLVLVMRRADLKPEPDLQRGR